MNLESVDHPSVGLTQGEVCQRRVGPRRVTPQRGYLPRMEQRHGRRLCKEWRVRMPAFTEHHTGWIVGFLDERLHVAMLRYTLGVGILGKRSETKTEALELAVAQCLITEVEHLVAEQSQANPRKLLIRETSQVHATDFRSHRRGQGPALDVLLCKGVVVEVPGGVKLHQVSRQALACRKITIGPKTPVKARSPQAALRASRGRAACAVGSPDRPGIASGPRAPVHCIARASE